jgi:uncharacterized protein YceH (UPF0502 family)
MATPLVVSVSPPALVSDVSTDVANAITARERLQALLATLARQRKDLENAFLRLFAADLAAVKGDPDKSFVDAQFTKFNAWDTADGELEQRIDALQTIADSLEERIDEFKAVYPNEMVDLLTWQIESLKAQRQKQQSSEAVLNERIRALEGELNKLKPRPATTARSAPAKKAASRRAAPKKKPAP